MEVWALRKRTKEITKITKVGSYYHSQVYRGRTGARATTSRYSQEGLLAERKGRKTLTSLFLPSDLLALPIGWKAFRSKEPEKAVHGPGVMEEGLISTHNTLLHVPVPLPFCSQFHTWCVLVTGICTGLFFLWVSSSFYSSNGQLFIFLNLNILILEQVSPWLILCLFPSEYSPKFKYFIYLIFFFLSFPPE